jgi:hypothetical protein
MLSEWPKLILFHRLLLLETQSITHAKLEMSYFAGRCGGARDIQRRSVFQYYFHGVLVCLFAFGSSSMKLSPHSNFSS